MSKLIVNEISSVNPNTPIRINTDLIIEGNVVILSGETIRTNTCISPISLENVFACNSDINITLPGSFYIDSADRTYINANLVQGNRNDPNTINGIYPFSGFSHAEGKATRILSYFSHAEGTTTVTGSKGFRGRVVYGQIKLDSSYGDVTSIFRSQGNDANNRVIISDDHSSTVINYKTIVCTISGDVSGGYYTSGTVYYSGGCTFIILEEHDVNSGDIIVSPFYYYYAPTADEYIGNFSHAEGAFTSAKGYNSHSEGEYSMAYGSNSHAEGFKTLSSNEYAHSEGFLSIAGGIGSHAEGYYTRSLGHYSHAEGNSSYSGLRSYSGRIVYPPNVLSAKLEINGISEKDYNIISGDSIVFLGHARSINDIAYNYPISITAITYDSAQSVGSFHLSEYDPFIVKARFTYNNFTYEYADYVQDIFKYKETLKIGTSHISGNLYSWNTVGKHSHAEGFQTKSPGWASHSEGFATTSIGWASHAGGIGTTSLGPAQTVIGAYNDVDDKALFIIGNGKVDRNTTLPINQQYYLDMDFPWVMGSPYQTITRSYIFKVKPTAVNININNLLDLSDNASALSHGLVAGDLYRTGEFLKVVY